jgi:hypothetical protein
MWQYLIVKGVPSIARNLFICCNLSLFDMLRATAAMTDKLDTDQGCKP